VPELSFGVEQEDVFSLTEELREARELFIGFSVSAVNRKVYENLRTPRYRGFFGYAQLMMGAFVAETIQLEFVNQKLLYHFDTAIATADTVVCTAIALSQACTCTALSPGGVISVRIPITSIRFRLLPGVLGNVVVKYSTYESGCGNETLSPPADEGQPPSPENDSYDPGSQPAGTRTDPFDPTGNDGDDPDAPKPDLPGTGGRWETVVRITAPDFPDTTYSTPGNADDVYDVVSAPARTDVPGSTCKARLAGRLNGSQVWLTDNCVSTVEAIVEKRYVVAP